MAHRPVIIFDTSAVNWLLQEPDLPAILAGLRSGFFVRVMTNTFLEIAATSSAEQRGALASLGTTLCSMGECILPFNWLLEAHIKNFDSNDGYDWRQVHISPPRLQDLIARGGMFTDDDLATAERECSVQLQNEFEEPFNGLRPKYKRIFESVGKRIEDFSEFRTLMFGGNGAYWELAAGFYRHEVSRPPSAENVRKFVEACPPFHALLLAHARALYERCVPEKPVTTVKKLAKRVDTYMSIYLPYCDQFITADDDQCRCFNTVVSELKLCTTVRTYQGFRQGLLLSV